MTIQNVKVFPEILIKLNFDFNFEKKLRLKCEESINYSQKQQHRALIEYGNATSTVLHNINGEPHTWEENQDFILFLKENIPNVLKEFGFSNKKVSVINSWINKHSKGGKTLEHTHQSVDLVVSSYIFCPEGSGNLLVRDPLEYHRSNDSIDNNIVNNPKKPWIEYPWIEVPVKTNDILIFPGWLNHKTEKSNCDLDRYVMTFNLRYT